MWYMNILDVDDGHVEAMSNLAAAYLALNKRDEAERYWQAAVRKRPSYFEAVEHLIGLLGGERRTREAVDIITFVETSLKRPGILSERNPSISSTSSEGSYLSNGPSTPIKFEYEDNDHEYTFGPRFETTKKSPYGTSGFKIPGSDNGRMLALIHAKGNMLYTLGDNAGAAKAFEDAVLVAAGINNGGIATLINKILIVLKAAMDGVNVSELCPSPPRAPVLLTPDKAVQTARLVFPPEGQLPGLREVPPGVPQKAAISTTSNSLLSLAKIFQDGMSTGGTAGRWGACVKDILALYYLSLSLHPSPSTANNVGIMLASIQQSAPAPSVSGSLPNIPGVTPGIGPGTGVGLALSYYYYGLNLDSKHAHLYTNLGSLLKDINQLPTAIKMYELAVACDDSFDIALANLANAVKDQGRISEAIGYYRRAVKANPEFSEAVCGLANALNSVCDWKGRGGVVKEGGSRDRWHVDESGMLKDARGVGMTSSGWMKRVVDIVEKQLRQGESWGKRVLMGDALENFVRDIEYAQGGEWDGQRHQHLWNTVARWSGQSYEGAKIIRMIERASRRITWRWYQDKYVRRINRPVTEYRRPAVPSGLSTPSAPTVLPFHTFTCPLSAKEVRLISERNGLRISCSTLRSAWLTPQVYPPPAPPAPYLKVGYVSSDFNNHPLAHLMQSVFGLHDQTRVQAYCYATTASDNSDHRKQIERESPVFYDAHSWGPDRLVQQIVNDGIHILINLNGFTRGARNEVFAARPAPIQMSFMGFAGTLGAEWCDYLYADTTAVPPSTLRPTRDNVTVEDSIRGTNEADQDQWVYAENIIFSRYSFFCCDHRQSAPDSKLRRLSWDEEAERRWNMRKSLFPYLRDDQIILGNFNQLYKIEPTTFRAWLRILTAVPNAVLWLLRFPDLGEVNLHQLAEMWATSEVASRIIFTDVAPKPQHISRAQVCDLFLDTPECNAHTTAADVLWSGTPLLTFPRHKHKMCSRIAASILRAAVPQTDEGKAMANSLIADSEEDYEERAIEFARGLVYKGNRGLCSGKLVDARKMLFTNRWTSELFNTKRWVRDLEDAYEEAWRKWECGEGGDIDLKRIKPSY
ncbi:glycosyl transferase family 41-domain-containing protein [Geopyxis carbonaria]|nr:glycosyl transferase family 41-domain-containing protein [Geopyxis carbonaria]